MDKELAFSELLETARQIGDGSVPEYQHLETFTVGAFDLAFSNLNSHDAFTLLSHACGEYPRVKTDASLLRGYLYMIADLAHRTNTTELPDGVETIVDNHPDQTVRLQEWYRISPESN